MRTFRILTESNTTLGIAMLKMLNMESHVCQAQGLILDHIEILEFPPSSLSCILFFFIKSGLADTDSLYAHPQYLNISSNVVMTSPVNTLRI